MKQIPLTQGMYALVNDADYDALKVFKWRAQAGRNTYYAVREERGKTTGMHRQILEAAPGIEVDHIDRNGLNNTRENLRLATRLQNSVNRKQGRNNTSGFRGVYWNKASGKWMSRIGIKGRTVSLGVYTDLIEAARAYDAKALELFGEFAVLNFPTQDECDAYHAEVYREELAIERRQGL